MNTTHTKQNNVSASLTIPITLGLKQNVDKIGCDYNSKMVETLKESINSRLSPFLKDESYKIAAMLDPRFKLRWCDSDDMEKNVLLLKQKSVSIP